MMRSRIIEQRNLQFSSIYMYINVHYHNNQCIIHQQNNTPFPFRTFRHFSSSCFSVNNWTLSAVNFLKKLAAQNNTKCPENPPIIREPHNRTSRTIDIANVNNPHERARRRPVALCSPAPAKIRPKTDRDSR